MVITRTPFRISFFGGGTDYPVWYHEHGGRVLSTTIDQYCYVSCRRLPPFFDHRYRVVYSRTENVQQIADIQHPAVRGVLHWAESVDGLEIHHDGDLPARTGLGSSSAFTVGLIHALAALRGETITKAELAARAIHVEQHVIGEAVGSQDQVATAIGGFNRIAFAPNGDFEVSPVALTPERLDEFRGRLLLFFTGIFRTASDIATSQLERLGRNQATLTRIGDMVDEALGILEDPRRNIDELGALLHESWSRKRQLARTVSTPRIDEIYEAALAAGASGGKILGAGGGGFLLLWVRPGSQAAVRDRLQSLLEVPVRFETGGSQLLLPQPPAAD